MSNNINKTISEKVNDTKKQLDEMGTQAMSATQILNVIEKEQIIEHCERQVKHWKQMCMALAITIVLIISSLVGGAIYVLDNYDFTTYQQDVSDGGSANAISGNSNTINNN